jgi:lactoylglutathione lyase
MQIQAKYTTLIVKNLEESVAFYRDALGFQEGYHVDNGPAGRITIMNSQGASVELIESSAYPVGMYSVGTDVDDLQAVLAHLKTQGVEPTTPVLETSVGHMTFIKDPNGVNICLIQHDKIPM